MLRFYVAATAIVLAVLLIVANLPHPERRSGSGPEYSSGRGTPGPPQNDDRVRTPQPTIGEAPWALDVLPECFFELSRASGTPAFVRAKRPSQARLLPPGSVLHVADCTLVVGDGSGVVSRGADRLTIPPLAHFYRAGPGRIVFDRSDGDHEEVRVFRLRAGGL